MARPPIFESPEEMEDAIETYFEAKDVYTVSGLAYHLGMTTETLRAYGEKDKFSATVKRAKQRLEMYLEEKLFGNNVTGVIFNLKNNFGWKDKQEIEQTGKLEIHNLGLQTDFGEPD